MVDPASGERRASTLADVAASARFCDALPRGRLCLGADRRRRRRAASARAPCTRRRPCSPTRQSTFRRSPASASAPHACWSRWPRRSAGGADELRRRPPLSLIACPVDPLGNDAVSLEAGLVCAAAGVPCGFLSLTLGCGTAPASLAGNLVVNAATVLADLVLLQLASPGAPVFFAGGAQRHGPAHRRLHRRRPRRRRPGRRRHAARPLVRAAGQHGRHGHRRQGARLAGGRRRRPLDGGGRARRRRHAERLRPARRLAHAVL